MAKYTVELGTLVKSGFDLGLTDYPIWYEEYRDELNQKIINHYKYREIGFETPGRFKDELNIRMREIMPYFVKLYETTILEYDPLEVVNYKEEYTITRDNLINKDSSLNNKETGNSSGTGEVKGNSSTISNVQGNIQNSGKNVEVDTPQGYVIEQDMDSLTHASKITHNKNGEDSTQKSTASSDDTTTTTTSSEIENNLESKALANETQSGTETMTKHLKGNYSSVSYQALIEKERKLIVNIDMEIIYKLNDLFMGIY